MMISGKVIDLFGYASGFSNSVTPIVLLAASLPLVAVNMIIAPALAALDRQRSWAFLGVGAAVLNISANLVAIPLTQDLWGNGGIGAGAVTTLTEVYLFIGGMILLPRGILDRSTFVAVIKCLLAGAIMAAVLWAAYDLSIFLLVPLGALVYGGATLAFGVFSISELKTVAGHALSLRTRPAAVEPTTQLP